MRDPSLPFAARDDNPGRIVVFRFSARTGKAAMIVRQKDAGKMPARYKTGISPGRP